jgi:hypothetical protein
MMRPRATARRRRAFALCLVAGFLLLVSAASARQQVVAGSAVLTGDNGDYTLSLESAATSTGPIRFFRWELGQGRMVTAASRVDGWQLGLNKPAPAPIIAGRATGAGIAPGQKAAFRILTDMPFDGNGSPGVLHVSEDGVTDILFTLVFGSPPKPKPQPTPAACNCQNITVAGSKYSSSQVNTGKAELNVNLNWTMTCSGPTGKCKGRIDILAPAGSDIQVVSPKSRKVTCNGRCLGSRTPSRGTTKVKATSAGDLYFDARAGKSFAFRLRLYCTRGGKDVLVGAKRMTFAFGSGGFLDKKKSDLNGNGVPDGKEKK